MTDDLSINEIPAIVWRNLLVPHGMRVCRRVRGGLSAARIWQCEDRRETACLRGWPVGHPNTERLQWIHNALDVAVESGLKFVPRTYRSIADSSFVDDGQGLWELTRWMPGSADYSARPSHAKLAAAVSALADLHACWHAWLPSTGSCPAIKDRIGLLENWLGAIQRHDILESIRRDLTLEKLSRDTLAALAAFGPTLLDRLRTLGHSNWILHPVLRDLHGDHVLYEGDRVSGLIDYGAMRIDTPATDLARLLGSLEPRDPDARKMALGLYELRIGYQRFDWEAVELLDQSSTLLSAGQWLRWLVVDRREFSAPRRVLLARWRDLLARVHWLLDNIGTNSSRIWLP